MMIDKYSRPAMLESGVQEREITGSLYLTRHEAARYLNLPRRWLANNTKSGPRYVKVGGLVRYSVEALDSFMTAHEGQH
jgi:excisionase family DNA binding protein